MPAALLLIGLLGSPTIAAKDDASPETLQVSESGQQPVFAASIPPTYPQSSALLVTYGTDAGSIEGDDDHTQVIYVRVPGSDDPRSGSGDRATDPADQTADAAEQTPEPAQFFLRLFDADVGGAQDLISGTADTRTRFEFFGGPGAYSGATARQASPSAADLAAGNMLAEATFGPDPALNNKWRTLASFSTAEGELRDGSYFFKLVSRGIGGDDANLYGVAVSLRADRNLAPEGVEMFTFSPTVRLPSNGQVAELRMFLPSNIDEVVIHNFDAAGASVSLETVYRSLPAVSSAQDEWRETSFEIERGERNRLAAIVASDGVETPNDVTFHATDGAGIGLPIRLPIQSWRPNTRPNPAFNIEPLADCFSVGFDASSSTDAENDTLSFRWEFGDGARGGGSAPVHRYRQPGRYEASLLVTDASGQVGNGAIERFVLAVNQPPVARAGNDLVTAPSESVAFDASGSDDSDGRIGRFLWDFGDGNEALTPKVSHTYSRPGRYQVTLLVADDSGAPCNSATDQLEIWVNAAPVAESGDGITAAVGELLTLDGSQSYDTDGRIVSHVWDLAEGTRRQGATIEHAFSVPRRYEVELSVRDDAGASNSSASDTVLIVINDPPTARAGIDLTVAVGEVVAFDGGDSIDRDGTLLDFQWEFGDGNSASGRRVSYAYPLPGRYEVALRVRDDSGTSSSSDSDSLIVVVNAPPTAEAGDDQTITASEVRFDPEGSADSDGQITRYLWEFGDGATSAERSPVHAYGSSGRYRVRLTVTDDSGTVRSSDDDDITIMINASPIADSGPDQIAAPEQQLLFSAAESFDPDGEIVQYNWDFGDGNRASGQAVSYAFGRPGTFTVRLLVGDDTGHVRGVDYDESTVKVNSPPVADAGPDLLSWPGEPVAVSAANSFDLDGEIVSYRWDFSDGAETAEGARTSRAYSDPGIYRARVTVTDDSNALNATAQDEITVRVNHPPVAVAGPDIRTWESTIVFDGSASTDGDGDALTYRWEFGDGSRAASGARVSHTYAEGGSYPVTLTVTDGKSLGNSVSSSPMTVTINRPPLAAAGPHRTACAGSVINFDGGTSRDPEGGLLRYRWDFGDGSGADTVNPTKIYRVGGFYPVTLTVEDDSGLRDSSDVDRIMVNVAESPIANAGPDQRVCANTEVRFDGSRSRDQDGIVNRYTWDFGDGTRGGGATPVHIYAAPGTYQVLLTIEGDQVGDCDYIHTDQMVVVVVDSPVARFASPAMAPVSTPVSFDAAESSATGSNIVAWRWDFGDGTGGEAERVAHTYASPGRYLVTLTITTDDPTLACTVVTTQRVVVINGAPIAAAGSDRLVAINEEVIFSGSDSVDSDGAIAAYEWDFGDGQTAAGVVVRHRFRGSGRYEVVLTVTDDTQLPNNAASDGVVVQVNDAPLPQIDVGRNACVTEGLVFSAARSTDSDQIIDYQWDFGDGSVAGGVVAHHIYAAPGLYSVTLTLDDGIGVGNSRAETTMPLLINQPPAAQAGPSRRVCAASPVAFDGTASLDLDGEVVSYRWVFGDGTTAEGPTATHRFATPGRYRTRLLVTDNSGTACGTAEDSAEIIVNTPPIAEAGSDREAFVGGAHDAVIFDARLSSDGDGDPLTYVWDFGDGQTARGPIVSHAYNDPGTYTVTLRVQDGSGLPCGEATDQIVVVARSRSSS